MEFDDEKKEIRYAEKKCPEFIELLSSQAPAPGGGAAAALVAAIGTALAGMVGNLTQGKKKYAPYEEDVQRMLKESQALQKRLLTLIDEDAENFLPLAKAYGLPSTTEKEQADKEKILERATKRACQAPLEMIEIALKVIKIHEELAIKGSRLAISDVAVGVQCLRAAIISAWVNVLINMRTINDEAYVADLQKRFKPMMAQGIKICDKVFADIVEILEKVE